MLLAACSSGSTSYRETLQKEYDTPIAASASALVQPLATVTPIASAAPQTQSTPTPSEPCRIVEYLTGYPTPSAAESVPFLSDPDPANGGVRYTGRIGIGPDLGDNPNVTYIIVITNESALPLTIRAIDFRLTAHQPAGASLGLPYFYSKGAGSFGSGAGEKATEYRIGPGLTTAAIFRTVPDRIPGTFDVEWAIQGTLGRVTVPVITPRPLPRPTPLPPC